MKKSLIFLIHNFIIKKLFRRINIKIIFVLIFLIKVFSTKQLSDKKNNIALKKKVFIINIFKEIRTKLKRVL